VDTLIFGRSIYETMITNILIKKGDERINKRNTSFDSESIYSLVDKPYYVDELRYKVDS
jgi:hypothetical protein